MELEEQAVDVMMEEGKQWLKSIHTDEAGLRGALAKEMEYAVDGVLKTAHSERWCSMYFIRLAAAWHQVKAALSAPPQRDEVREWRLMEEVVPSVGVCVLFDANSLEGNLTLHTAPRSYDKPWTHFLALEPMPQALAQGAQKEKP